MESFYNHLKSIALELPHNANRIIIVGKGPSLKEINNNSFNNSIIINVNDSEIYQKGHFTLFHSSWILDSLKKNGFKNKYYLTDQNLSDLIPTESNWIPVLFKPVNNEGPERIAEYFNNDEFFLLDFLLASALKFAYLLNQILKSNYPIYLIGFDFSTQFNNEIIDSSGHDNQYKQVLFKTQKEYFKYLSFYLKNKLHLNLFHVGNGEISDLNVFDFNLEKNVTKTNSISPKFNNNEAYLKLVEKCENEDYTLVVAELTNNHIGQKERLIKMIKAAKDCGADMIKIQKRDIETFYSKEELLMEYNSPFGNTLGDYRRGVELNPELMNIIIQECEKNEICWFASILDYPSLKFIMEYDAPLIKLPSTISNHRNFLKKAGQEFNGDLVISTGFTDTLYENFVLENFTQNRKLFLLQCTSSYPAPPEACQISIVRHYDELRSSKNLPNLLPGYSSHDLGSLGSMMAIAAGAKMVEKHVKYGNLDWIHFDGVALDLDSRQFEDYVKDIRKANLMCGNKIKKIHEKENHKYKPNKNHN